MHHRKIVAVGAVAVATVAVAAVIRHFYKKKKPKQTKTPSSAAPIPAVEAERIEQIRMDFMDDEHELIANEFDRFRNRMPYKEMIEFDQSYSALRDILEAGGIPDESHQVGLIFISSVVLRNRMEKLVFTRPTWYLLEGNAELLPAAIQSAARNLSPERQEIALEMGKKAMNFLLGGFDEEQLYAVQ